LAAVVAGMIGITTLPAAAQSWGWNDHHWNHGHWNNHHGGFGVSVGFGTEPYAYGGPYAYAGPGACTCPPRFAHRTWGTRAYAYEPDYAYAYAPGYAYGYDYDYAYQPGISVGFGFADTDHRFRHRSGRHWRGSREVVRGDRQRVIEGDRGFMRAGVSGDADFRASSIRSSRDRVGMRGDAQMRTEMRGEAQMGTQMRANGRRGSGNAELRGNGRVRGGAQIDSR
jgi:hypothetical protein